MDQRWDSEEEDDRRRTQAKDYSSDTRDDGQVTKYLRDSGLCGLPHVRDLQKRDVSVQQHGPL